MDSQYIDRERMRYRYGWIEASLKYIQRFGASEKLVYCDRFSIAKSVASRDQQNFMALFNEEIGDSVVVKLRGKLFWSPSFLIPQWDVFKVPAEDIWVRDFLGPKFVSRRPARLSAPDQTIISAIIRAIKDRRVISIDHKVDTQVTNFMIAPHSIMDDGVYYIRGWRYDKNSFDSIPINQISGCADYPPITNIGFVDGSKDVNW
jgi:hypothetical protein